MAGVEDDISLAADMLHVEALLGHNVVRLVKDNHILDLLRTYSTAEDRVQKVVNELQRIYPKDDDFSLFMDGEDDDVLLALDNHYFNTPRLNPRDHPLMAQNASGSSNETYTTASSADVSSSSNNASPEAVNSMMEPILQPAKLHVDAGEWNKACKSERPRMEDPARSNSSKEEPASSSFANHRNAASSRTSDSSSYGSNEDSEPEVISIHEEDRKRRKHCGSKSPGKKTKVEVVDLVTTSPSSVLNCNEYFGILQAMFPDADPDFLRDKFKNVDNEQDLNVKAAELLEANNYPRTVPENPIAVDLERPGPSSNHNSSSVILKPSVLERQNIYNPQPSTSSIVSYKCVEGSPNNLDGLEEPLESPEECLAIIKAMEETTSSIIPQLNETPSVPHSTGFMVLPQTSVNQSVTVGQPPVAQVTQPSVTDDEAPRPSVPSTQTVPSHPNQAGLVPNNHSAFVPLFEPSDNFLKPDVLAPSSSDKKTVQPAVLVGRNDLDFQDVAGPSVTGTNYGFTKEEPWAEKYSLLLCLLPQSDPKYLEEKARQLHDKAEEFNLFVETSLETLHNPPLNNERRGNGLVAPAVPAGAPLDVKLSGPATIVEPNPNAPQRSGANLPGSNSFKTTVPNSANIPKPSRVDLPAPSLVDLPGPARTDLPGPSRVDLSRPSQADLPGPKRAELPGPSGPDPAVAGPSGLSNNQVQAEPWAEQHSFLLSILPDADPSYLEEKAKSLYDKDEELKAFVTNALENKDYPTMKDFQRRQELIALQNKYLRDFNIENFLDIVPEPFKYFSQSTRNPTADSKHRGLLFLQRKYRLIRSNDITVVYKRNNYNLTNTCHELDKFQGVPLKTRRPDFKIGDKLPDTTLSLQFLQEVAFIENEDKIKKFLKDKEDDEKRALQEARRKGELLECNCCFDDEVLARNIVACPEGHVFCKDCVRRGAETKIGEGTTKVACLTECQAEFTLQSLQGVLKPTIFSKLAQRKQVEEIKAAGIEDIVECPFCDFCNIPGAGDKVFRCLNPDCMKNSCIMCKEESHIPLRCNEVEKASEVKMRTYIEAKMTEALVRTCWKCQREFVKIDGCNKMTCQCGALMCYVCRQPVKNYSHFNGQGGEEFNKCPLFSDNNALHVDAVEKVAAEAKAELAQKHPGLTLKHDPTAVPLAREPGGRLPGLPRAVVRAYEPIPQGLHAPAGQPFVPLLYLPPYPFPQVPAAAGAAPRPAPRAAQRVAQRAAQRAAPAAPMPAPVPPPPVPAHMYPHVAAAPRPAPRDYGHVAHLADAIANRYRVPHAHVNYHRAHHAHAPHAPHANAQRAAQREMPRVAAFQDRMAAVRNMADMVADLGANLEANLEAINRDRGQLREPNPQLAYHAGHHVYPNNQQAPYNVAAPNNGNALYVQNIRQRREYENHPN